MLLIDLVMISAARQELIKARLATGNSLLAAIGHALLTNPPYSGRPPAHLSIIMNEASANCIAVLSKNGQDFFTAGPDCESGERLQSGALLTLESEEPSSSFAGITKGVFWPDRKSLLAFRPVLDDGEIVGAVAVALNLEGVYQSLRYTQSIFFVYFLVNLLVFTLLGFYQLYRRVIKPVNHLVNTAEGFRDDEEVIFLPETRFGEFNRLSHSLNKMIARINRDQSRLKKTVSDLEEANFKLRKTRQEIIRSEKLASVGRLSAGIAHEIGNPIGIVIGYLDLLKKDTIPDKQKKDFICRAENEVNRVNTIIRQLLDFARQPPNESQSEISVHKAINEVVEICKVQPMMAGIAIDVEDAAADNFVIASSGQLKQVFLNLLINSADAINSADNGPQDGRILVRTINVAAGNSGLTGAGIRIQISDNGPGIETGDLENIFDPFYTSKEPGKGTGLGLSICFTLIENMGGIIRAASDSEGTTLTVILPLSSMSAQIPG